MPRTCFILLALFTSICSAPGLYAQQPLSKTVSVKVVRQPVDTVLSMLSRQSQGAISYIGSPFRRDSLVTLTMLNKPLKQVLDQLFQGRMQYVESGDNIILQRAEAQRERHYVISGTVRDRRSGVAIQNASIYEHSNLTSTFTDGEGRFHLRLRDRGRLPSVQLTVSKEFYLDTALYVMPGFDREISVSIAPAPPVQLREFTVTDGVEKTWLGKRLLSSTLRRQTQNISRFFAEKPIQSSLVPSLGSHGKMAGQVVNKFSLNIVGGYAAGLDGVEVAGGFNINKKDVQYAQVAGLFNMVGGHMKGAQATGGMNRIMKSARGAQAAGIANIVDSSLTGAQAAGGINKSGGNSQGAQVAGLANVSYGDFSGMQAAGGLNTIRGQAAGAQVSGLSNFNEGQLTGIQVTGGLNHTKGQVSGLQIAGIYNSSGGDLGGLQLAGAANRINGSSRGMQLGLFNYARHLGGLQFGLINVADSSTGTSIGLVNIVRKNGYYKVTLSSSDLLPVQIAVKTGRRQFYSMLVAGKDGHQHSLGFGIGREFTLYKNLLLTTELVQQTVFGNAWEIHATVGRLLPLLNYRLTPWLAIQAGPALSIGEYSIEQPAPGKGYPSFANGDGFTGWLGWQAGITLF
ncbi:LA_2272 family surface repeat-containing protein [Chitinophaga alhagiae]|uniref:LA_2272 family surface repeat-containing protein n=1 Tax=Chitinophaga alhagiae TaxID=2203219 RepID=UPI000E5A41E8|nr:hypothetical protein [Chitinophaga alhagiae]